MIPINAFLFYILFFTERDLTTIAFSSFSKLQSEILIPFNLLAFFNNSPKASAAVFLIKEYKNLKKYFKIIIPNIDNFEVFAFLKTFHKSMHSFFLNEILIDMNFF